MSLLAGQSLRVIDVETTGLFPDGHRLVEVASVRLDEGVLGESWSSLVRPGRSIPADATAVHGITNAMVRAAPAPQAVAETLGSEVGDRPLVFHNASFDLPFLHRLMRDAGQAALLNPVLDTLGLARGLDARGGHGLGQLAARYRLGRQERHRALPDAVTTAHLLVALADRWERDRGVRSFWELAAVSQDALRSAARG